MSIEVKKVHELATFEKASDSDIGFDLTCCDVELGQPNHLFLNLGVKVKPPTGYYFDLVPRSSFSRLPLIVANSFGIIDPDYRGEWRMPVKFYSTNTYDNIYLYIQKVVGVKVAQAVLRQAHPWYNRDVLFVDELDETPRGAGGFGSTDIQKETPVQSPLPGLTLNV